MNKFEYFTYTELVALRQLVQMAISEKEEHDIFISSTEELLLDEIETACRRKITSRSCDD